MATPCKKVLLADDDLDVHAFVRAALEDDGYELVTATDGAAALDLVRTEKPDIALLDVQMPGKDGFQVFAELRRDEATRTIPIIMLTGVTARTGIPFDAQAMGEFLGNEPEAYIEKPIDPEALRATVSELLKTHPTA